MTAMWEYRFAAVFFLLSASCCLEYVDACSPAGTLCVNDDDCCSKNCYEELTANQTYEYKCQVGADGCTAGNGKCLDKTQCCSYNCYGEVCQPGSGRCTYPGGRCKHDIDCCEGTRCWANEVCSGAGRVISYVTCALSVVLLLRI